MSCEEKELFIPVLHASRCAIGKELAATCKRLYAAKEPLHRESDVQAWKDSCEAFHEHIGCQCEY